MDEFSAETRGGWAGEAGDCEYDGDAVKAITARKIKWSSYLMDIAMLNCSALSTSYVSVLRLRPRLMSHISREKLDLINRTKKVVGQLEAVQRALEDDAACADLLQRLAAARGSINSLMGELMEDHIRNHMPRNTKSSEEAADDVIEIIRTYLK